MRHFTVARFLQGPGGDASEHVHRVNASSAMGERCLMGINFKGEKGGPVRAATCFSRCIFCYPLINFTVRITQN